MDQGISKANNMTPKTTKNFKRSLRRRLMTLGMLQNSHLGDDSEITKIFRYEERLEEWLLSALMAEFEDGYRFGCTDTEAKLQKDRGPG